MPYELFLALNYLRARRRGRSSARVTALVAVIGIACGVAALVIAMALANGFRDEMRDKILRGTAHVTLARADGQAIRDWRILAARLKMVAGVTDASPTSYTGALLEGADAAAYAVVRGVAESSARELDEIRRTLTSGSVASLFERTPEEATGREREAPKDSGEKELIGPRPPGGISRAENAVGEDAEPLPIIVGAELAARAGLHTVGDEGWLVTGEKLFEPPGFATRSRRVRVAGVFRSGLYEYDSTWVYAPLAGAAEVAGAASDAAPALSVETADIYRSAETAARIRNDLGAEFTVVDWQEANRPLFAALALEQRTVSLIIALILLVAALNITTTLVLVVVERRADVAVLGAMGARARSIMLIFVAEGAIIGALGVALGVALGLLACLVGDYYHLVSLPADVYSLSNVPFHPRPLEVALAALAAFVVSFVATLYPARSAARLRPAEALRYE